MNKGSVRDIAVIILIFFISVFIILGLATFFSYFKTEWLSHGDHPESEILIWNYGTRAFNMLIDSIPIFVTFLGIAGIIFAFLIPAHPVFLPLSIMSLVFYVLFSVLTANIMWAYINSSWIIDVVSEHSLLIGLIRYFPFFISAFGFVIIIVMYHKGAVYE